MKDKEYHLANFATFVSKTLTFSPQKMDEINFRPALKFFRLKFFTESESETFIEIRPNCGS